MAPPLAGADHDDGSTIRGSRYRPERTLEATFALTVVDGPDRGARLVLDGHEPGPVLIGQSPTCALRLTDRQVSRRHASLEVDGVRVRLTDLASTNGTFVDGVSVLAGHLRGGETIRVGATSLQMTRLAELPPPLPSSDDRFGALLGESLEMRRVYPLARRLAASAVPLVIEGETGTGKEVLAEAIHDASPRASGPYIVLDCTTVAASLAEAELFGHERGAFTGAVAARKGVFEQAHGGTLLLDEIGDLDLALQAKLLRAIERSEIRRVGGSQLVKVDVRIIAATRRDLDREVQEGRFRDDLFHRLAVARIELPALRRRGGDIAVLARHFWNQLGGADRLLPDELLQRWEDYAWPGNVRELRNAIARQLAIGDLPRVAVETEPATSNAATPTSLGTPKVASPETDEAATLIADVLADVLVQRLPLTMARVKIVEVFERLYIERVLAEHGGNIARAAASSGIARRYFQLLRSRHKR